MAGAVLLAIGSPVVGSLGWLEAKFELRNEADYGDFVERDEARVRPFIAEVGRFLARAEELLSPPGGAGG